MGEDDSWRRAMFGGRLTGRAPVRYIYVDEAGTSAHEPVTIVVGVIVHADTQVGLVDERLVALLDTVPGEWRDGFVSHAKSILGNNKYGESWPYSARVEFVRRMMSIPREAELAISVGVVRRDAPLPDNVPSTLRPEQFQHVQAFWGCICQADQYTRKYAGENEAATVVAEDVPDIKRFLRAIVRWSATSSPPMTTADLKPTMTEQALGFVIEREPQRVSRVRDVVHFVDKRDSPFLQIADACAYGFRRYFAKQSMGHDFIHSIIGRQLVECDWDGPASFSSFYWHHKPKPLMSYLNAPETGINLIAHSVAPSE